MSLVEQKLAACVNIIPGMHSIYRWDNEVCEADEVILIAKTTVDQLDALTWSVMAQHSYECPCIAAVPLEPGNPAYFAWLSASVKD